MQRNYNVNKIVCKHRNTKKTCYDRNIDKYVKALQCKQNNI